MPRHLLQKYKGANLEFKQVVSKWNWKSSKLHPSSLNRLSVEIFVGLLQTSSNFAYMPGLYEMKIPLKKSECVMFRAGNVYPARCRQPGVGAGTTDQWERWPGPPCRGRGCHRAQPRHSPVDGGSLPSHRGLDETTFLDNCILHCTVLYWSLCAVYLYLLALYHGGEEAGGCGWKMGELGQSRQGEQPSGCQK